MSSTDLFKGKSYSEGKSSELFKMSENYSSAVCIAFPYQVLQDDNANF